MKLKNRYEIFLFAVLLGFLALIQIIFAYAHSLNFGPSSDILWGFPQATALMNNQSYIIEYEFELFGLKLPLATGAYQGGIKPYVAALWMMTVGYSYFAILMFNSILSLIALISLCWAAQNSMLAVFCVSLLLGFFNLHFVLGSILDYGPFLIQFTFITISLGCVLRSITRQRIGWNYMSFFFLGLALNEKITTIPTVAAIIACQTVFIFRNSQTIFQSIKNAMICVVALCIGALPYLIYFFKHGYKIIKETVYGNSEPGLDYVESVETLFWALVSTYNSLYFSLTDNWHAISDLNGYDSLLVAVSVIIISAFFYCTYKSGREFVSSRNEILFLITAAFVAFFLQAFIPGLHRPWHVFSLYPTIALLLAYYVTYLQKNKVAIVAFFYLFTLLSVRQTAYLNNAFHHLLESQGKDLYSPALMTFSKELAKLPPARIGALTYSMSDPIFVLTGGKIRIDDFTWWDKESVKLKLSSNDITYYVLRNSNSPNGTTDPLLRGHNALITEVSRVEKIIELRDKSNTEFLVIKIQQ